MATASRPRTRPRWLFKQTVAQVKQLALRIKLRNITFCVLIPLAGMFWSFYQPLVRRTVVLAFIFYIISGIGITAGYHRLWSHRSYTASYPLRCFLALCGISGVQGSILTWCKEHRAHHRYVDTSKDPYNVKKGLLWSHMGWIIFRSQSDVVGNADVSDLLNDKIVMWQHNNFSTLCLFTAYILPSIIAQIGWNDGLGGLLYAGIIRAFFFQQCTNCVNSLAHYLGDQPYADKNSPRNHILTALITFGEGYHNFHHEFPADYRNGIRWFDYDPTKWCITLWTLLGLASHPQQFDSNEIEKAIYQQKQKQVQRLKSRINWGHPLEALPIYTWSEYEALCVNKGGSRHLVCIAGVIYDVASFIDDHPGGRALILASVGKDATASFHGGVYDHSKAASNLLDNMRFGVLRRGGRVEAYDESL
ncbi:Acyl-CoA desaturase [Cladobotryum mycophilum]|uniref:Acyl-CoA desaturase n=1 Tax=Cladobotryum mycophilum TaxID=491253 RepID=A0ABR0SZT3_9HYPO